jgi:hypothetical protein
MENGWPNRQNPSVVGVAVSVLATESWLCKSYAVVMYYILSNVLNKQVRYSI